MPFYSVAARTLVENGVVVARIRNHARDRLTQLLLDAQTLSAFQVDNVLDALYTLRIDDGFKLQDGVDPLRTRHMEGTTPTIVCPFVGSYGPFTCHLKHNGLVVQTQVVQVFNVSFAMEALVLQRSGMYSVEIIDSRFNSVETLLPEMLHVMPLGPLPRQHMNACDYWITCLNSSQFPPTYSYNDRTLVFTFPVVNMKAQFPHVIPTEDDDDVNQMSIVVQELDVSRPAVTHFYSAGNADEFIGPLSIKTLIADGAVNRTHNPLQGIAELGFDRAKLEGLCRFYAIPFQAAETNAVLIQRIQALGGDGGPVDQVPLAAISKGDRPLRTTPYDVESPVPFSKAPVRAPPNLSTSSPRQDMYADDSSALFLYFARLIFNIVLLVNPVSWT